MIRVTLTRPDGPETVSHVGLLVSVGTAVVYLDGKRLARRDLVKAAPDVDLATHETWRDEHGASWSTIAVAAVDAKEVRWK